MGGVYLAISAFLLLIVVPLVLLNVSSVIPFWKEYAMSNLSTGTFDVLVFALGGQRELFPVRTYKVIGSKTYAASRAMADYRQEHKSFVAPQIALGVEITKTQVAEGTTLPPMPERKQSKRSNNSRHNRKGARVDTRR